MDCTGETRREHICRDYRIYVVGCIKLYGSRTIKSDAGGKEITDKYYMFRCVPRGEGQEEIIKCGYPAARHICMLSRNELPIEFNPFVEHHMGNIHAVAGGVGARNDATRQQLRNAIMLFITRYATDLEPKSAIFKIKDRVESSMDVPAESKDVKALNTILDRFSTTMPRILNDLETHATVRKFKFDLLDDIISKKYGVKSNYK